MKERFKCKVVRRVFFSASEVHEPGEILELTANQVKLYEPRYVERLATPKKTVTKAKESDEPIE